MTTPGAFYQTQAKSLFSDIPWVAERQSEALYILAEKGFPTIKDEDWKYTKLDALWQENFTLQHHTANLESLRASLPREVLVLPLKEALLSHTELLKECLSRPGTGFHALNTACLEQGLFIYVPEGISLETPVTLLHQMHAGEAKHIRNIILVEAHSSLAVIEDYTSADTEAYLTNTVTDIYLKDHASLVHYKIQRESVKAFHIGLTTVKQASNSHFESHSLSLGGKLVRSDVDIQLQGNKASCVLNGIYIPGNSQHIDHHTTVNHAVADCKSDQDYKGILMGVSKAVFNGKVLVAKQAQHTDANQNNKNLLLSKGAEINTKPQLEIFADDVICTHGAAVGQLDEDALFYLATRGIDREQASAFLVQAFVNKNLQMIPHDSLAEWMAALINEQLELRA